MKKFALLGLIVVITFMFSSPAMAKPKQTPHVQQVIVGDGTMIYACYQKINGQLRVVGDLSQCRPSEFPLTLTTPPKPKIVFITSGTFPGDQIGGIADADALCNQFATTGGLPGTYKAWISDDVVGIGPATTFIHSAVPYVNTVGNVIANDWIGLTSGVLLNPILYDETGADLTPATGGPIDVWTGTDPLGNPVPGLTCAGWSAAGVDGIEGYGNSTNTLWTLGPPLNCASEAHLYCFEQ
jgi:hypothetical protein